MTKHTPQETLATLQKAFSTGDLNLALTTMTADVFWNITGPADVPYLGVFYGHDGFSRFWWLLNQTVQFHDASTHTTLFGDQTAVALGGESGTSKATGAPYHYDWAVEYRFNEAGLITRMRQYFSRQKARCAHASKKFST